MFQTKVVAKIKKKHFIFKNNFFEYCVFMRQCGKI